MGSLNKVDRLCTFGPKVHNLQGQNDNVTSRVLEVELIPFFLGHIGTPLRSQKNFEYGRTPGTSIT